MKKMMFLLMVAMATSAFSVNSKVYGVFSKLNNEATLKYISNYLNADQAQIEELEAVFYCTDELIKSAEKEDGASFAASAVNYNQSLQVFNTASTCCLSILRSKMLIKA